MERTYSDHLSTVPAAIFGVLAFYILFRISRRFIAYGQKRLPVEARGGWPVIGHLHLLGASDQPGHISLAKMADVYGPIFTVRFGIHKWVIISNFEIAKECLVTKDLILATRPKRVVSKLLGYDNAMLGFNPYDSYWRQIRKIVVLKILSNNRLEMIKHIRLSEVQSSIKELYEQKNTIGTDRNKSTTVEMKTWFGNLTLNTIFRVVVGKRFTTSFDGAGDEKYREALKDFTELVGIFLISDSIPFLEWFDLGGYQKKMKKTSKNIDMVFDKWLEEHRRKRNNSGDSVNSEEDFIDIMLSAVGEEVDLHGYDGDTVIKATCLAMIVGGSDTTTITMTWALSLLLNNREVLKKAQQELDEKIGKERLMKESDVPNLPYLQAIVKETLRLYPAAPLGGPREAMEDCTLAGYDIPKGTRILVNLQKLHKDPSVWESPDEFKPDRFLTNTHKDFDVRGQTPELIPFGSGRRICPGISFALQIMHLTLGNLIHGFEIETLDGKLVDMKESIGATNANSSPLHVLLTPRLPPHVYV